jgi:hypothetical protein
MRLGFVVESTPGRYLTHTYFWYGGHPGIHSAWVHHPEDLRALFFSRTTNCETWDERPQNVYPAMFDGRRTVVTGKAVRFDAFLASLEPA